MNEFKEIKYDTIFEEKISDEEEDYNRQKSLYGYQVGDVNGPAYEKLRNREMEGKTIKGQIQRPYNRKGIAHPKFR